MRAAFSARHIRSSARPLCWQSSSDEDWILARMRALRSDLIDPTVAVHHRREAKRTGDGSLIEFRSVVDAVRCAIEVQNPQVG
jgi:adenylate cyclase